MTANQRIDAALEAVLKAAGSSLKYYSPQSINGMREAMRKALLAAYTDGSHATFTTIQKETKP